MVNINDNNNSILIYIEEIINRKFNGLKNDIFSMISANKTEHTENLKTENTILKNQNASKDLIINILHEQLNSMQQITKHLTHNVNSSIDQINELKVNTPSPTDHKTPTQCDGKSQQDHLTVDERISKPNDDYRRNNTPLKCHYSISLYQDQVSVLDEGKKLCNNKNKKFDSTKKSLNVAEKPPLAPKNTNVEGKKKEPQ